MFADTESSSAVSLFEVLTNQPKSWNLDLQNVGARDTMVQHASLGSILAYRNASRMKILWSYMCTVCSTCSKFSPY